jgi:uncharacterized short protein YbdD (DUF466 family)
VRRLSDALTPAWSALVAGTAHYLAFVRGATARLRHGWLSAIGAPDYRAYLAHYAERHPGTVPMSERDYVNAFIERRYNARGPGRCC